MSELNAEQQRLAEARSGAQPWKRWGPYLSERQWGTVREDYSENGDAWNYFTHDQARSRAYKWGEDGMAGYSDDRQLLCWGLALWNGRDPILKERLFGLSNSEGNHGEDVKEVYYYLDSTPTHSWMRSLYKYPQAAYPYADLVETNRARSRHEMEYELIDTGVFDEDRYFDVFVEFAKAGPEDTIVRVTAHNRGPEDAPLHLLPQLWFRNTWWRSAEEHRPSLSAVAGPGGAQAIAVTHPELGVYYLHIEGGTAAGEPTLLFSENETNRQRIFGEENATPYVKDAFHAAVIEGRQEAVNPAQSGTKAAAHYQCTVPAGGSVSLRLRLTWAPPLEGHAPFGPECDAVLEARREEADLFYAEIIPAKASEDEALVMRQALAGMLWTKQFYSFDLDAWLQEHRAQPLGDGRTVRNQEWFHMVNEHVISMPDKWEYPWYAAWDLAFHTIALSVVDPDFAQGQLKLMLRDSYLHPNGQIPAYEWNFSDVNPPVHAFGTIFNFVLDRDRSTRDLRFLRNTFSRLLLNFSWWVNRKDPRGRNAFNGGFLGLDNIGVFDRSATLPTGGFLEQADGTAWMAFYCQNMLELAIEIATEDSDYEDFILKFLQHFLLIAGNMDRAGDHADELWDEEEGFFYDVLVLPDGRAQRIRVRSLVGLLPLAATTVIPQAVMERFPSIVEEARRFMQRRPELTANIQSLATPGVNGRRLLSVVNEAKLRRILARMLDEDRFLSPHGIRSLSKWHETHPYTVEVGGAGFHVGYLPAESDSGMFGGNSNWRGPIWMPTNLLLIRALLHFYSYYGDDFKVEMPTGSGQMRTLFEVAKEIADRLISIFTRDEAGRRPVFGEAQKYQSDPHWRDYLLFYEYFHGDNGAGLGASHQTGWTGIVARLIQIFRTLTPETLNAGADRPVSEPILEPPQGAANEGAANEGAATSSAA